MSSLRNIASSRSVAIVAVATVSASSFYWMYPFVSKYGWMGILRFIWQGDPYPANVRESVDVLDEVERSLPALEHRLEQLEESLARSKLNVIDGGDKSSSTSTDYLLLRPIWSALHAPRDVRKDLAQINAALDHQAANVDTVYTYTEQRLKIRKKALSQVVVVFMGRLDVLLASYGIDESLPRTA